MSWSLSRPVAVRDLGVGLIALLPIAAASASFVVAVLDKVPGWDISSAAKLSVAAGNAVVAGAAWASGGAMVRRSKAVRAGAAIGCAALGIIVYAATLAGLIVFVGPTVISLIRRSGGW